MYVNYLYGHEQFILPRERRKYRQSKKDSWFTYEEQFNESEIIWISSHSEWIAIKYAGKWYTEVFRYARPKKQIVSK